MSLPAKPAWYTRAQVSLPAGSSFSTTAHDRPVSGGQLLPDPQSTLPPARPGPVAAHEWEPRLAVADRADRQGLAHPPGRRARPAVAGRRPRLAGALPR